MRASTRLVSEFRLGDRALGRSASPRPRLLLRAVKPSGPTSSDEACREELLVWLDAHAQWPVTVSLESPAGGLVADMTGRLNRGAIADVYDVDADGGSLQFTIPPEVAACGSMARGRRA
jgi:hypothetical protein